MTPAKTLAGTNYATGQALADFIAKYPDTEEADLAKVCLISAWLILTRVRISKRGCSDVLRTPMLSGGYRVQSRTDLTTWATQATLGGVDGQLQYVHTNSVGVGQRFWRVQSQEGGIAP